VSVSVSVSECTFVFLSFSLFVSLREKTRIGEWRFVCVFQHVREGRLERQDVSACVWENVSVRERGIACVWCVFVRVFACPCQCLCVSV